MLSKPAKDAVVFGKGAVGRFDQDVRDAALGATYEYECVLGKPHEHPENPRAIRQSIRLSAKRIGAEVESKVIGTVVYWRVTSRANVEPVGGGRPPARTSPPVGSPSRPGGRSRSKAKTK